MYKERKMAMNAVRSMSNARLSRIRVSWSSTSEVRGTRACADRLWLVVKGCGSVATEPCLADALGCFGGVAVFGDLVEDFFGFAQVKVDVDWSFFTAHGKAYGVAWLLVAHPTVEASRRILFVPLRDHVANAQACGRRWRIRIDTTDYQAALRGSFSGEAERGAAAFRHAQL